MYDTINLVGAAGGQGCTTLALLLGLTLSTRGRQVNITGDLDDLCATAGVPIGSVVVAPNLSINMPSFTGDVHIVDHGRHVAGATYEGPTFLVLRGPSYTGLRRALTLSTPPDGVIIVAEPGRSLGELDVEAVLGVTPVVVPVGPVIARAGDAGLLLHRSVPYGVRFAFDRLMETSV